MGLSPCFVVDHVLVKLENGRLRMDSVTHLSAAACRHFERGLPRGVCHSASKPPPIYGRIFLVLRSMESKEYRIQTMLHFLSTAIGTNHSPTTS